MIPELAVALLIGVAATVPLLRADRSGTRRAGVLLIAGIAAATAAVALAPRPPAPGGAGDPDKRYRPAESRAGGYVSSDTCRSCHPSEYASWHRTYHRTMTQVVTPETVIPVWEGTVMVRGREIQLGRERDELWVDMVDPVYGEGGQSTDGLLRGDDETRRIRRRVLLSTGSHLQQVYWVQGADDRTLHVLPFAWLVEDERWIPYENSFLAPDTEKASPLVWNEGCIQCHTTAGRPGFSRDTLSMDTTVGEVGIGCESCHGPGRAHVEANQSAWQRYFGYLSDVDDDTIIQPEKLPADRANQICGQCHAVLGFASIEHDQAWWTNGFAYRPGDDLLASRRVMHRPEGQTVRDWITRSRGRVGDRYFDAFTWDDGQVRTSGRDYNGIRESACARTGELRCTSCHSMHDSDRNDQLAPGRAGDGACLQCHAELGDALADHTRHAPESDGSRCYNCHMPHTTYGLLKAIRSHTLGKSPSVRESVEVGRPNACNLCHLDRSLGWTRDHLEEWYGVPPVPLDPEEEVRSAAALWLLRGDAGQRAIAAWHMGWEPARAASGDTWLAPLLAQALDDPYTAVRYLAGRSLRRVPEMGDVAYDFIASREERLRARAAVLARADARPRAPDVALFVDETGAFDRAAVADVVSRRDDRVVRIAE